MYTGATFYSSGQSYFSPVGLFVVEVRGMLKKNKIHYMCSGEATSLFIKEQEKCFAFI